MKNAEEMVLKMEKHSTHVIFVMGADKPPLTKVSFLLLSLVQHVKAKEM